MAEVSLCDLSYFSNNGKSTCS